MKIVLILMGAVLTLLLQKLPLSQWEYHRQKKDEKQEEIDAWFKQAKKLTTQINLVVKRYVTMPELKYEKIQGELDSLSGDLAVHADEAPDEIDDEIVELVGNLSMVCAESAIIADVSRTESGKNRYEKFFSRSKRFGPEELTIEDAEEVIELLDLNKAHFPSLSPEDVDPEQFLSAADKAEGISANTVEKSELNLMDDNINQLILSADDQVLEGILDEAVRQTLQNSLVKSANEVSRRLTESR